MARYIEQILQPGEKVLYSTTLHGIIYLPAVIAWIVALGCFVMERRAQTDGGNMAWLSLAGLAAIGAVYWTVKAWFQRWITETDVTSLRVVHKEGFIQRNTFEMNLDKVESVDVDQSILGRIFGYGNVTIFGVGEGRKTIEMIASPLQFRNHITAR
ncbi:PH domain-containing protein [Bradyrhizobium prioriisuperbiae]|uniref:PH domain-containing protein n=1 Tax=Bradyrhizobium prioriisuperbiae TaxID=2854389 RepID=UPI0028E18FA7|nr:PH domain-containing protein [Bradyrhizobium prioritasuperba]